MKFVIENLVKLLNCEEYEIINVGLNCIDISYDLKPELLNIVDKIKHIFETYTIQFYEENYITLTGKWKNVFDTTYVNYNDQILNPIKFNHKIHSSVITEKITNLIPIQTTESHYIGLLDNRPIYIGYNESFYDPRYIEVYDKISKLSNDNEEFNFKFQKLINEFHQYFLINKNIKFYEIYYLDDKTFDKIISMEISNEINKNQNKSDNISIDIANLIYAGFILKEDLDEHIRTRS